MQALSLYSSWHTSPSTWTDYMIYTLLSREAARSHMYADMHAMRSGALPLLITISTQALCTVTRGSHLCPSP